MRRWLQRCRGRAIWVELEEVKNGTVQQHSFAISVQTKDGSESEGDFQIAVGHPHPFHLWVDGAIVARLREALSKA